MTAAKTPDLAEMWREGVREWEKHTNAALNKVMGEERYSQGMNGLMGAMLKAQAAQGEHVEQALARMNLPSKADFRTVLGRMDDIDRRLDVVIAMLEASGVKAPVVAAVPVPTPKRTRKAKQDPA